MKLTTEEKAKLKSNIEKIKAYIEAEICPKLCGEAVTVYFGNVRHFANGTTGKEYHLYVDGRGVCGGAGNLSMSLLPTNEEYGCADFCTRPDAGLELIHSWSAIKPKLLQKVQDVAERKNSLDNFEL